jgi:cyclophilin family peptidyl-prolyl cis-trans isomerase
MLTRTVKRLLLLAVSIALLVVACGDDGPEGRVTSPEYEAFRAQPTACGASAPPPAIERRYEAPDDLGITTNVLVTVSTSCGQFTLELAPQVAPIAVNSFVFLAEDGYFDGTAVHRLLPGFVIQAGDPTASGTGGPGYRLPDELPPDDFTYVPGIVAMANAGPNSAGSQFFIVIGETGLRPDFTVFGAVVDGGETLARIAAVPRGPDARGEPSRPLETVYIESMTVTR